MVANLENRRSLDIATVGGSSHFQNDKAFQLQKLQIKAWSITMFLFEFSNLIIANYFSY